MRRVVFLVMALLIGLTGCSSSKGSKATAGTSQTVSAAVTTSAAAATSAPATTSAAAAASAVTPDTTSAPAPSAIATSAAPSPAASTAPSVGAPSAAPPTTTAAPSPVPTKPNLKKQVLALSDLPAGWSIDKSATNNSSKDDPACFKAVEDDKSKPAGKASVSYQGSPDGLPSLQEDLAYGNEKQAIVELAKAKKALDKCGAISIPTDSVTLKGRMSPMSFPTLGDGSVAYQITLTGVVGTTRVTAGMDLVLFRSGNEEGSLLYATLGTPDIAGFEAISKLAVSKIRDGGGVLS